MAKLSNKFLAQVPTFTLKGNNTGGTANVTDLTVSQVNTMLGTFANPMTTGGDIIYGGTSGAPTRLPNGTSGQVLTSNGGTSAPSWQPVPGTASAFFASSQVTTDSSAVTGTTFTTFSNSPAFTFVPNISGTYKVYSSAPLWEDGGTNQVGTARVFNTTGGATLLYESQTLIYGAPVTVTEASSAYTESIYTLTAGVSYVFDLQGKNNATGSFKLLGSVCSFYMFAELQIASTGLPRSEVCVTVGNGSGSTNTFVRRWTNSTNGVNGAVNVGTAITYADSSTLGATFTINENGIYAISYDESQSVADQFGVSLNQITGTQAYTQLSLAEQIVGSSQLTGCTGATLYLAAGSIIRGLWGNDAEGSSHFQKFRIIKVNS